MWSSIPEVLPFLKREKSDANISLKYSEVSGSVPRVSLDVSLDRKVYRPGDTILATVEIGNNKTASKTISPGDHPESYGAEIDAVIIGNLTVEVKGTEKLDTQWIITPKVSSKLRKGERTILESLCTSITSNAFIGNGHSNAYLVRTSLPKILPPTYRGTAVRYFYYLMVRIDWLPSSAAGVSGRKTFATSLVSSLEKRVPINVWTMPNCSGLSSDDMQGIDSYALDGIVPITPVEVEIQWKENNEDAYWCRAVSISPGAEDDTYSQESGSVPQSPTRAQFDRSFSHNSGSISSGTVLGHSRDYPLRSEFSRMSLKRATPLLATALETDDQSSGAVGPGSKSDHALVNGNSKANGVINNDDALVMSPLSPAASYIRGKTYNIRIDDEVLVRFSPKNPDSTYYFGDMVAGVISFPKDEGSRKCLEVSAFLETREVLNPSFIHPSRRNSPIITKVQAEYYEVVADMLQTHIMLSIPLDGPASFSTPHISVQWILRFEFVAAPKNARLDKYHHPLQIRERERGEWVLPLIVHAPLPRTGGRKEKALSSLKEFWVPSPKVSGWTDTPICSPPPLHGLSSPKTDGTSQPNGHHWAS